MVQATVGVASGEEVAVDWMPSHAMDIPIVTAEEENIAHHAQVKDPCAVVLGATGQEHACVGLKECLSDGILMTVKRSKTAAIARIPQLDLMVLGARDKQSFGGMPVNAFRFPAMARQVGFFNTSRKIPDLQRCIVRGSDEPGVGRRKSEPPDGFVMPSHNFDVVEIRLPVFDEAVLVGRQ